MRFVLINNDNRADYQDRLVDYFTHKIRLPDESNIPVRIRQVAIVCLDAESIVGVATILRYTSKELGLPLWFYRTSVVEGYRQQDIARTMANTLFDHLQALYRPGDPVGFYFLIESNTLIDNNPELIWPRMGAIYIGQDQAGRQKRVKYFQSATLDDLPGAIAP
jgi:hypothetical protein